MPRLNPESHPQPQPLLPQKRSKMIIQIQLLLPPPNPLPPHPPQQNNKIRIRNKQLLLPPKFDAQSHPHPVPQFAADKSLIIKPP